MQSKKLSYQILIFRIISRTVTKQKIYDTAIQHLEVRNMYEFKVQNYIIKD
jgi:hypothetical protein